MYFHRIIENNFKSILRMKRECVLHYTVRQKSNSVFFSCHPVNHAQFHQDSDQL